MLKKVKSTHEIKISEPEREDNDEMEPNMR